MINIRFFTAILILAFAVTAGCSFSHPGLPAQKDFSGAVIKTTGFVDIDGKKVKAVFISALKPDKKGELLQGVGAEQSKVKTMEMIAVVTEDDAVYYTDIVHDSKAIAALKNMKINTQALTYKSVCGSLDAELRFSPDRDVLCPLDSGYKLSAEINGVVEEIVIKPLYDSSLYQPYHEIGRTPSKARTGFTFGVSFGAGSLSGRSGSTGRTGQNGSDGHPGRNAQSYGVNGGDGGSGGAGGTGKSGHSGSSSRELGGRGGDGGDGQRGGDGGNGANGADGYEGANGGPGEPGHRAEDGPVLKVVIKPIYSKFYPNEELVFMQINASWFDVGGAKYLEKNLNYIFHPGDKFTVTSRGGKGGSGGDGGRGGDGGSGGAGGDGGRGGDGGSGGSGGSGGPGDQQKGIKAGNSGAGGDGGPGGEGGNGHGGGNGAMGGDGGDGGHGGRGGDGGKIIVSVNGSNSFLSQIKNSIQFYSIPGEGGQGGQRGENGMAGFAGRAGNAGDGGNGGSGGSGNPSGKSGSKGQSGKRGSTGNSGHSNGHQANPGATGPAGQSVSPQWQ